MEEDDTLNHRDSRRLSLSLSLFYPFTLCVLVSVSLVLGRATYLACGKFYEIFKNFNLSETDPGHLDGLVAFVS